LHWYFLVFCQVPQENIEISCVSFTIHNLNIVLSLHLEKLSDIAGLSKFNIDLFYSIMNFQLISIGIMAFLNLRIRQFVSTSKNKERLWFSCIFFISLKNEDIKILICIGNLAFLLWCYQCFRVSICRNLMFLFRE